MVCHDRAVYISSQVMLEVVMPVWHKYAPNSEHKDAREAHKTANDASNRVMRRGDIDPTGDAMLQSFVQITDSLIQDISFLVIGVEFEDENNNPTGSMGFLVDPQGRRVEHINIISEIVEEKLLHEIREAVVWLGHFLLRKRCHSFEVVPPKLPPLCHANAMFMYYLSLRIVEGQTRERAGTTLIRLTSALEFADIIEAQLNRTNEIERRR